MDIIERVLGFSPDNGSGVVELLLLTLVCALVANVLRRRRVDGDARPRS